MSPSNRKGSHMAEQPRMPETGEPAPPIDAATADGGRFSLAQQHGRWAVVYFYPRANTPG